MKQIKSLIIAVLMLLTPFIGHSANITLAWDAPSNTNDNITAYHVYNVNSSIPNITNRVDVSGNVFTAVFTNIVTGTNTFWATAENDVAIVSDPSNIVLYNAPTQLPIISINKFNSVTIGTNGLWTISISWNGLDTNKYGFTNYTVALLNMAGNTTNFYQTSNTNYTFYNLPLLDYKMWVFTTNLFGVSQYDTLQLLKTKPSPPINLKAK
jgi:hypothetical protein